MIRIIALFTAYHLVTSTPVTPRKRLLQYGQTASFIYGSYHQMCLSPRSDFACQYPHQSLTDKGSGILECSVIEYTCCVCGIITCGTETQACDAFKAGADYAAFGVKEINIFGQVNGNGAIIDCNAPHACAETEIFGSWIDTIQCSAGGSCSGAVMVLANSRGIICGEGSCIGATVILNSNRGGELICGAENACLDAHIQISGIVNVKCNGPNACKNTKIIVDDPSAQFQLDCNGVSSCSNLDLTINVAAPAYGCRTTEPFIWKGINCGANDACAGMTLTVVNNGCRTVIIEDLKCSPDGACTGAVFDLHAGTGFGVEVQNCICGPSCQQAVGLDVCFNNVQLVDCSSFRSCAMQTRFILNAGNDLLLLCSDVESCAGYKLNIIVSEASQNLVQRFSGYICSAAMSCQNAVINLQNKQITNTGAPVLLTVKRISCTADKACDGATFIIDDNVEIKRIICVSGACDNCMVEDALTNIAVPCDQYRFTPPTLPVIPNGPVIVPPQTTANPQFLPIIQVAPSTTTTTTSSTTTTTTGPVIVPPQTTAVVNNNPQFLPIIQVTPSTTTTTTSSTTPATTLVPMVNIP